MDLQTLINTGLPATEAYYDGEGNFQTLFSRELTPEEWLKYLELTDPAQARKLQAKANAKLALELKSLTPAQAVSYIDSKVTSVATAKVVLKIMVRMLIAMRDEIWPDLPAL